MRITLAHPLNYKDSELDSLDLDLDSLTGNDLIAIEDSLRASGNVNLFSQAYFAAIAARSAHIPLEVLKGLPVKDFMKVTSEVVSFLGGTGSEEPAAENSAE
ncbi:MAG: phage tail assembly protein [Synergistaceae bacterium]|nr:phage tail assembly protein [Synergistaceae bacterium]